MFLCLTKVDKSAETRRNLHTHTHTHTHTCNSLLSIKQIGTICFAIFSFVFPSFGYVENNDPCTDDTLNTYSGSANLTANWDANEIELHWYNGNDEIENIASVSQSCVYDGTLTPPATIPTREGYTFRGWRARQACSFSSSVCGLDRSAITGLTSSGEGGISNDGQTTYNANTYDLTSAGTWAVAFTNGGIIHGLSSCNDTATTDTGYSNCDDDTFKPANTFNTSSTGQYCWCRLTSYTPSGETACNIASSSWVFFTSYGDNLLCAQNCTKYCSSRVRGLAPFRLWVFGVR